MNTKQFIPLCLLMTISSVMAKTTYVDASARSGGDGSSWKAAFDKLQDALSAAKSGDQVLIAEGIYFPDEGARQTDNSATESFLITDGVEIYGGYESGGSDKAEPTTFRTVLSGDITQDDIDFLSNGIAESPAHIVGKNSRHVVTLSSVTDQTVLDGLVVTAGDADATAGDSSGGGLLVVAGDPLISRVLVSGNFCTGRGGGVHLDKSRPVFTNCEFSGNQSSARGGGVGTVNDSSPTFYNCLFKGNRAERGGGANFNSSTPLLVNCTFSGNNGTINGGGIQAASSSVITLKNSIIWNNFAGGLTDGAGSSVNLISSSSQISGANMIENTHPGPPEFLVALNPNTAPNASSGDMRLGRNTSAAQVGLDADNPTSADLSGQPRVRAGRIDLGAYERGAFSTYVDGTATGANDGSSWADAYQKLRDALDGPVISGDSILIAGGVYYPDEGASAFADNKQMAFELWDGVSLFGAHPPGGGSANPANHPTILSGDLTQNDIDSDSDGIPDDGASLLGNNSYNVLRPAPPAGTTANVLSSATELRDLIITAGRADGINAPLGEFSKGGGMLIASGAPVLRRCRFVSNSAVSGGGLYVVSGPPTAGPKAIDCQFDRNVAGTAGAIHLGGGAPDFEGCDFLDNEATNNTGTSPGAVFSQSASARFTACEFLGNVTDTSGGAFASFQSGSTYFESCLFSGNQSTGNNAAAIYINTAVTMVNCTITGNVSGSSQSGAIFKANGALNMTNCIIWNNRAGLITISQEASIRNSGGSSVVRVNCLIQNYAPPSPVAGNLDGRSTAGLNPDFVTPIDLDTVPTLAGNLRIVSDSVAQSAGDKTVVEENTDLDENPRISGAFVDLGAYEIQLADADGDGLSDAFEQAHTSPSSATSLAAGSDGDNDNFTALEEFALELDPNTPNGNGEAYSLTFGPANRSFFRYMPNPAARHYLDIFVEGSEDLGMDDPWDRVPLYTTGTPGEFEARSPTIVDSYFHRIRVDP